MLELKNVSFAVDHSAAGKEILQDVSLTVGDARCIVITGPNGGGKSTLARVIAGIEKPTAGRIVFDGEDITERTVAERAARGVAYAFQQPVRFKGLTVRDLLLLATGKREADCSEDCLGGYLCDVGLCARDYINREVNASLSGGEIKRIEIAMAIARKARLTIFDEPEAGIDLWSFHNLIDVFKKLRHETKGSILIISHQERILEIADEIVVLADGRITDHGPREQVLPGLLTGDCRGFCPRQKGGVQA